jgi:hypothetical protein
MGGEMMLFATGFTAVMLDSLLITLSGKRAGDTLLEYSFAMKSESCSIVGNLCNQTLFLKR